MAPVWICFTPDLLHSSFNGSFGFFFSFFVLVLEPFWYWQIRVCVCVCVFLSARLGHSPHNMHILGSDSHLLGITQRYIWGLWEDFPITFSPFYGLIIWWYDYWCAIVIIIMWSYGTHSSPLSPPAFGLARLLQRRRPQQIVIICDYRTKVPGHPSFIKPRIRWTSLNTLPPWSSSSICPVERPVAITLIYSFMSVLKVSPLDGVRRLQVLRWLDLTFLHVSCGAKRTHWRRIENGFYQQEKCVLCMIYTVHIFMSVRHVGSVNIVSPTLVQGLVLVLSCCNPVGLQPAWVTAAGLKRERLEIIFSLQTLFVVPLRKGPLVGTNNPDVSSRQAAVTSVSPTTTNPPR